VSHPNYPPQAPYDPRDAKARAKADKAYAKAQRPWFKKKRFILPLVFFVLIILIASLSGGGDDPKTATSSGATPSAAKDPAAPPAFPGAKDDDIVVQAGEPVTTDSKVTMTATSLSKGDTVAGQKTMCSNVSYANGGDDPATFNGGFDWKLQDPNGAIVSTGLLGSDKLLSAGQLAPGGKVTGDVCFSLPNGSAKGQYVLLLDPSFRFTSDRIAWINNL
jgi:Domain of unknown function (DUF4352)